MASWFNRIIGVALQRTAHGRRMDQESLLEGRNGAHVSRTCELGENDVRECDSGMSVERPDHLVVWAIHRGHDTDRGI